MFGNFIHFIIVLLIYATYQPSNASNFPPVETACLFAGFFTLFGCYAKYGFKRLERRLTREAAAQITHLASKLEARQTIVAIGFYAINIYGLNLTIYLSKISIFRTIPTLQAVFCVVVFLGYLIVIWSASHRFRHHSGQTNLTLKNHVISNLSFALPVLLPWIALSGMADLIQALPFKFAKQILSTAEGQLVYFLVFLGAISIVGPAMIQKFWRCKPLEIGPERDGIERVCRKAGVAYNNILRWPIFGGQMITAGVMGLVKRFRYILVTDALLRYLSFDELDAVMAHEIGHVKQ
ncbi:MAG: M48 family metalloprotease, partial [Deltaproteobacteria bacterium]|nr:M48 family metalloprotease [Deltaproteobacteria bacterium]